MARVFLVLVSVAVGLAACEADDPAPGGGAAGLAAGGGGGGGGVGGSGGACPATAYVEDVSACVPAATDYRPRDDASANDGWPACISDDGSYHRVEASVSSIARVEAFERIADLLWRRDTAPSPQDFLDARVDYAADQGLDSRVQRREDLHFPPPASGACTDPGVPAASPERCVGPARLLPILGDAFAAGIRGEAPRVEAARIEAALLWFLYVSVHKEANTCAATPKDCDSSWAYYGGGGERAAPLGLGAYVRAIGPETHDRAVDGTLAVRCWRNLAGDASGPGLPELQGQAIDQLDRALLRGVALVARERFRAIGCLGGAAREADLAFLRTLVPFLDRAARERDPAAAGVIALEAARGSPDEVDGAAAVAAIDALFPCP